MDIQYICCLYFNFSPDKHTVEGQKNSSLTFSPYILFKTTFFQNKYCEVISHLILMEFTPLHLNIQWNCVIFSF